jgi:hypothetical protein
MDLIENRRCARGRILEQLNANGVGNVPDTADPSHRATRTTANFQHPLHMIGQQRLYFGTGAAEVIRLLFRILGQSGTHQ